MSNASRAATQKAAKDSRATLMAAQNAVIRDWWDRASIREIAMMVDLTAESVLQRGVKMGLKSRPVGAKPQ